MSYYLPSAGGIYSLSDKSINTKKAPVKCRKCHLFATFVGSTYLYLESSCFDGMHIYHLTEHTL